MPYVYLYVHFFCSLPFLYFLSLFIGYISNLSVMEDCKGLIGSVHASCSELEMVLYYMIAMIAKCILLFTLLRLVGCLDQFFSLWRIITAGFLNYLCCISYTEVCVGSQVLLASRQVDCYLVVAVYRKSKTYTPHLTT